MILLSTLCVHRHQICGDNWSWLLKMDESVLEEKSCFKMLELSFSSKLNSGFYPVSIAKTVSKKIGALIRSVKLLFPEVALYIYKSTMPSCMECCGHAWAGAPGCFFYDYNQKTRTFKLKIYSRQIPNN